MHGCRLNSYESQIGWMATAFPKKMGSHYKRSMGPQHDTGISHRLPKRTIPSLHAKYTTLYSRGEPANPRGGKRIPTKRSSVCGNNSTDRVLLQPISSPKKGWRSEASHQSKGFKPVCLDMTFQDGRDPHFKRDCETN